MFRTFNMGIGYVMVVAAAEADALTALLQAEGQRATVIGEIIDGPRGVELRPMTRIVVLGGGFAGLEAMRVLERRLGGRADVELLLVSDRNYLLFTPLLPQVASSLVEPRHILQPIRDIRGARRFRFRRDSVVDIDLAARRVILAEGVLDYDRLVIAVGGVTPTFGIPGVEEHALAYKHLEDAVVLRDHLIDLAEHADHEPDPATRRRMLTVCVVGRRLHRRGADRRGARLLPLVRGAPLPGDRGRRLSTDPAGGGR